MRLIAAKSRVAPIAGTNVQRIELQGLVTCTKLVRKIVEALPYQISRVTIAGDSMSSIMSQKKDGSSFNPFFQSRLHQVEEELAMIRLQVGLLDNLQKIPGHDNPADLCTRDQAKPEDLGPETPWQKGPPFLSKPREEWPISEPNEEGHIPEAELKTKARAHAVQAAHPLQAFIRRICGAKTSLNLVINIVARVVKAGLVGRVEEVKNHPLDWEKARAEHLLLWAFRDEVRDMVEQGRLKSLHPVEKGGLFFTQGRFTADRMLELVGKTALPIVDGKSRLGLLYAIRAHREDHRREVANVLARASRSVWLVGGRKAATLAVHSCMWCRLLSRRTHQQIMARLPPQVMQKAAPFTSVCLDLFGPMLAKGIGGFTRKLFKTWGVVFVCLGTKAVAMWLSASYSSGDFHLCFQKQCAIYGKPALVISDKGSQLVSAGRELEEWEALGEEVKKTGTEWRYTPTACPGGTGRLRG